MTEHRVAVEPPPLAGPEATPAERDEAIVARMVARHGAPSLEQYRAGCTRRPG